MTETNNFSFDDGFREYTINNDPNRVLRVNTRDYNILQRVSKALNELDSKIDSLKEEDFKLADDASEIEAFDFASDGSEVLNKFSRSAIDEIFYPGACDIIFGNANPMSTVNGVTIFEGFLRSFAETIRPILEEEEKKRKKKQDFYKKKYDELHAKKSKS